jgi:hypothetical protein
VCAVPADVTAGYKTLPGNSARSAARNSQRRRRCC